jgi:hypothetical protein
MISTTRSAPTDSRVAGVCHALVDSATPDACSDGQNTTRLRPDKEKNDDRNVTRRKPPEFIPCG